MTKVLFSVEEAWIIRSVVTPNRIAADRLGPSVSYYETPSTWNKNPALATIFRNFEAAQSHLRMYRERDDAPLGWANGSTEVFDVVTLHAALVVLKQNGATR